MNPLEPILGCYFRPKSTWTKAYEQHLKAAFLNRWGEGRDAPAAPPRGERRAGPTEQRDDTCLLWFLTTTGIHGFISSCVGLPGRTDRRTVGTSRRLPALHVRGGNQRDWLMGFISDLIQMNQRRCWFISLVSGGLKMLARRCLWEKKKEEEEGLDKTHETLTEQWRRWGGDRGGYPSRKNKKQNNISVHFFFFFLK